MPLTHSLFAILVSLIWGLNFLAIKYSYESFTPFASLSVRFLFTIFPLIFFIPKPNCTWRFLLTVSLFQWIAQFGLNYTAMYIGLPSGLCALVLQSHVLFTVLISIIVYQYKLLFWELSGIIVSLIGIFLIGFYIEGESNFLGFLMSLGAGLSISIASFCFRGKKDLDIFGVMIWSCLFPPIPMILSSLYFEGPMAIPNAFIFITWPASLGMIFTVIFSTIVATPLWFYLLRNHEPVKVTPFTLLIPVVTMICASFAFDEHLTTSSIIASIFIITGLFMNQFARRLPIFKFTKDQPEKISE